MNIAVIGAWHQASVVSACLADMGHSVTGIGEADVEVQALNAAHPPVYEPELENILQRNIQAGRLRYTTSYRDGLAGADIVFICIDTPVGPEDESDLTSVYRAAEQVAVAATGPFILCVSAQVPVGTCAALQQLIVAKQPQFEIPVVYVPEFLRLGAAVETFRQADRFVIGADDPVIAARVAALYRPLGRPIRVTTVRSAEMAKHASNAFLATAISFSNQIADLCERTGADVTEVTQIMKLDRRIGEHAFLGAGLGYAGGTLGREVKALQRLGRESDVVTNLLDAVAAVNGGRLEHLLQLLRQVHPNLTGLRIGIWGLVYKSGTSTLRQSAALRLIDMLTAQGAHVAAFDPLARFDESAKLTFELSNDPLQAAKGASALILVTPWAAIDQVDFSACAHVMRHPVLIDAGNYLTPARMTEAGFTYIGIGRSP